MGEYNHSMGAWVIGIIDSGADHDGYHIDLTTNATCGFYAANISITDAVIALYSPSGTQVVSDDNSGWGTDSFIDDYVPTTTGKYDLQVDGYGSYTGSYVVGPTPTTTKLT